MFTFNLSSSRQFGYNGYNSNLADVKCGTVSTFHSETLSCFLLTLMVYVKQLSILNCTTLHMILTSLNFNNELCKVHKQASR